MIKCLECNKELKEITNTHLKKCCGLTTYQYKEKHTDAILVQPNSRSGCLNPHWKNLKRKYCIICNKEIRINSITDRCIHHIGELRKGVNNSFFGKKHSLETRQRMCQSQQKRDKSTRFRFPITKEIIEKREKTKKENWNKLTIEEKQLRLKNWIESSKKNKSKTKIENIINDYLTLIGMEEGKNYKRNFQLFGYNVDFLINNDMIVECYGDYWHKNPKYFIGETSEAKRNCDLIKENYLKSKGFSFIYFWEEDIYKNFESVISKLEHFLGQYYNIFQWEGCSEYQNIC